MSRKPVIALFASTLHSYNPRGTGRLFRFLAEQLARYDEFDAIVLEHTWSKAVSSTFTHTPLRNWLQANPIVVSADRRPTGFFRRRSTASYSVPRLSNSVPLVQKLYPAALLRQTLHPTIVQKILWVWRQIRQRCRLSHWLPRPPAPATKPQQMGPQNAIGIEDIDLILNFFWFNAPDNPLLRAPRPPHVRSITWFLDAIPLRVGHFDVELGNFREHYKGLVNSSLGLADHVIAISESARRDLVRFFHVPEERTSVVPCGTNYASQQSETSAPAPELSGVFKRLGLDPNLPIVLGIGMNDPWKNTLNILRACRSLTSQHNQVATPRFQLVFVGEMTKQSNVEQYAHLARQLATRMTVVFAGYLSDNEVNALMRASSVFLFPSLWEGFGIPPLDAMSCGVPVVVSDTGPLPDVCGPHAIYCDPFDPESIAHALQSALNLTGEQLDEYRAAAALHAKRMSWDAAGDILADVIRRHLPEARTESPAANEVQNERNQVGDFASSVIPSQTVPQLKIA